MRSYQSVIICSAKDDSFAYVKKVRCLKSYDGFKMSYQVNLQLPGTANSYLLTMMFKCHNWSLLAGISILFPCMS